MRVDLESLVDRLGRSSTDTAFLAAQIGLTPVAIRKALLGLRRDGLIEQLGGRGSRNTTYVLNRAAAHRP